MRLPKDGFWVAFFVVAAVTTIGRIVVEDRLVFAEYVAVTAFFWAALANEHSERLSRRIEELEKKR